LLVRAYDGTGAAQQAERRSPHPFGASGYHRVVVTVRERLHPLAGVAQRSPARDAERDEVGQGYLPIERRRNVAVQQDVALVDGDEERPDDDRRAERAPQHGRVEEGAARAAKPSREDERDATGTVAAAARAYRR
jgi:hypothetical protein